MPESPAKAGLSGFRITNLNPLKIMATAKAVAGLLRNNLNAVIDSIVDNNPSAVATNLVARNVSIGDGSNLDLMKAIAGLLAGGDTQTVSQVLAVPFIPGVLPAEYDTAFGIVYAEKNKRKKSTGTDILDTVGEMNWGSILCAVLGTCPDNVTNVNNNAAPPFYATTTGAVVIGGGILLLLLILFLLFR